MKSITLRSPWRPLLMAGSAIFLFLGVALIGNSSDVPSRLLGIAISLMAAFGLCRSAILGVKIADAGVKLMRLEKSARVSWCDVESVALHSSPDIFRICTVMPMMDLKSGESEDLDPLTRYAIVGRQPRRIRRALTVLTARLDAHRATCDACSPRQDAA